MGLKETNRTSLGPCSRCGGSRFSKNGFIRGVQRYRCLNCGYNVAVEARHRWPGDAKLFNLFVGKLAGKSTSDIARDAKTTPQTVSRWIQDVWEGKEWFIDAAAAQMVFEVVAAGASLERALWGAVEARHLILDGRGVESIEPTMERVAAAFARMMKSTPYSEVEIAETRDHLAAIIAALGAQRSRVPHRAEAVQVDETA